MKIILTSLLAYGCIAASASATTYSVSGRIVEANGGEACPGATFRIYSATDTIKHLTIGACDTDGKFSSRLPDKGDYLLKSDYTGLKATSMRFSVSEKYPHAELGVISLSSDFTTIGEVVVTAQRKLVESDGATLTYNVEEDPQATTRSTLDMLRRVPMVSVDAEENIKVKGQSNFKIYLNGKEDPMLSGDPKTVLKSLPASSIKKIEVITEPGAKYDAEGTGGILNIVTATKQNLEGYMANFSLWHNVSNTGASAYGRTKIKNVTASVNASYNDSRIYPPRHTYSSEVYENLLSETDRTQRQASRSKSQWNYTGADINLSWEPDTLNLLTFSLNFGKSMSWNDTRNSFSMTSAGNEERWSYIRDWSAHGSNLGLHGQLSYQHTFRRTGHHIVASYLYNNYDYDYESTQERHSVKGLSLPWLWGHNVNDNSTNRHTIQLDYTNPLGTRHTIEAGAKAQLQRSEGNSYPLYGMTYPSMEINSTEHIKMTQFQDIAALYVSYTGNFGNFSGRAGIRWEYTHTGIDYKVAPEGYSDFTTVLNDIIPNLSLTYRFSAAANMRLAYQMRINRPGISQLNPYRNEMTTNQVSYGNPDLDSQHSNQISLTYSNYGNRLSGNVGISYSHTQNYIEGYSFIKDGVFNSTFANIGRYQWANLNGYIQWTIITDMQLSLYAGVNYEDYRADSPELKLSRSGWSGNFNANFNYTLPFRMRLSAYGGAGTKWITLQQQGSGWYYYGMGISRSFLKEDALTINIYTQNFANPKRNSTSTTDAPGMRVSTNYRYAQWSLGIGLSYRFGSLSSDVKRTAAQIESESTGTSSPKGGSR